MSQNALKLAVMKELAMQKAIGQGGRIEYLREIDRKIDFIAMAGLQEMAPVNENLLGLAMLLNAEVKRLHGNSTHPL